MPVRILCTGDIHIGRQSSKTLSSWRTADAWNAIVELAIREQVDLLAISGDLIDMDGKHYEAFGPVASGLHRLAEAGIETVAITGNHDWDVLPRIAQQSGMEHLHLIGAGGTWQRHTVMRNGSPVLHVDGWSFPAEHVHFSPLTSYPAQPDDDVPVLGMVHGEVHAATSNYAPVSLASLWNSKPQFWLLGHIHAPQLFPGPGVTSALYPGSPFAMDPGEPGVHGAWLLQWDAGAFEAPVLVPLSPVQYLNRDLDVAGIETDDAFIAACHRAMRDAGQDALDRQPGTSLQEVSLRLHCHGATPAHASFEHWANRFLAQVEPLGVETIVVNPEKVTVAVTPPVNLESLADGHDPLAETARFLLSLEGEELAEPYASVLQHTIASFKGISADANFALLEPDPEPEMRARDALRTQGWKLLSALMATREQA